MEVRNRFKELENIKKNQSELRKKITERVHTLERINSRLDVDVTNRFKGLDLIECLKNYGQRFVTWYRRQ